MLNAEKSGMVPSRIIMAYVLTGFFLPWLIILIATIRYHSLTELAGFPRRLFSSGYGYVPAACLNVIPFFVAAACAVAHFKTRRASPARGVGLIVGALIVLLLSIVYQGLAWFNLVGPHPDALTGVVFLFFPWIATLGFFSSGSFAWLVAALWLRLPANRQHIARH